MTILEALLGKNLLPRMLHIVEHECHEFHLGLFFGIVHRRGHRAGCGIWVRRISGVEKIGAEDEAEDDQDERTADPQMRTAEATEIKASTAAFSAPIFDVRTVSTRCPLHGVEYAC